jgi:hypothetical protein
MEPTQEEKKELDSKPEPMWFFERGDGMIFSSKEQEAWDILHNVSNWQRRDFKLIGHSDGTTYFKSIKESKNKLPKIRTEIAELEGELSQYSKTEERFKFEDLLDDKDPKMVKVKELKKGILDKLKVKNKEINGLTKNINQTAFDAELEKARGNIVMPGNKDIIVPNGQDPKKIHNELEKWQ